MELVPSMFQFIILVKQCKCVLYAIQIVYFNMSLIIYMNYLSAVDLPLPVRQRVVHGVSPSSRLRFKIKSLSSTDFTCWILYPDE